MATITQTIPNFVLGMSEAPDDQKLPGMVRDITNGIPDVTEGLTKRQGTEFISTLTNVQADGCWFYYYRDEDEGSYIGQTARNGIVRVWRCNDGQEMTITGTSSPATYLTHTADGNIQTLTINDATFLCNRTKTVAMTSATAPAKPHQYSAYVELKQVLPRRMYALNIFNNTTLTTERSARVVSVADSQFEVTCSGEDCVVPIDKAGSKIHVDSATGIAVRVTVTGQPYIGEQDTHSDHTHIKYYATYTVSVDLLHGGSYTNGASYFDVTIEGKTHTINIDSFAETGYKTNLSRVRPIPIDIDSNHSTDAAGVLSSVTSQISNVTKSIIGNGIYLNHSSAFNVEALETDLFNIITDTVNNVTDLPRTCKNGYIVKVTNSAQLTEDDYYLKFIGDNNQDGSGHWEECAEPGIETTFDSATLPYVLKRTGATTMTLEPYTWSTREVGDELTNSKPSFVGQKINQVLFHRDRLAFLSKSNLILSQPGSLGNFWNKTALTFSGIDRVDLSCSSSSPNELVDGIEMNTGLVLFSGNAQYLFATDSDVLNPETAKIYTLSTYNYNTNVSPISLGTSLAFIDNAGKFSRFFEMSGVSRETQPQIEEKSKVVSRLLGNDLDLIANSRENSFILMTKSGSQNVIGYKYFVAGNKQLQVAWFRWRFRRAVKFHFIVDDDYYIVYDDSTLTKLSLKETSNTPTINDGALEYNIHLDHLTEIDAGAMSYNSTTRKTTFALPAAFNSSGSVAAIVTNDSDDKGRYQIVEGMEQSFETLVGEHLLIDVNDSINAEFIDLNTADLEGATVYDLESGTTTLNSLAGSSTEYDSGGQTVSLTGDWTNNPITIGYLFEMSVELPTIFPTKVQNNRVVADTSSSLIVQRLKFNFGDIGEFWTILKRNGKPDYLDKHESSMLNSYESNTAPYASEVFKTVPVYERNTNVNVILKSTHPSPATLQSMAWEGEYNSRFYKRI